MTLLGEFNSNPVVHAIAELFGAAEEPTLPDDFLNATDDTIQPGDFVYTVFGWWGVVNRVKVNGKGMTGYSVNLLYRTSNGHWIAPANTFRHWVWDSDVVGVLS